MIEAALVPRIEAAEYSEELLSRAETLLKASCRESTRKAYVAIWHRFAAWCDQRGRSPLPASLETILLYTADVYERIHSTSARHYLTPVDRVHVLTGHGSFFKTKELKTLLKGVRRASYGKPGRSPLALREDLCELARCLPCDVRGARDRALFLFMFASAMRLGLALSVKRSGVVFVEAGVVVSTGDPRRPTVSLGPGAHQETCPVRALRTLLGWLPVEDGLLFPSIDCYGNVRPFKIMQKRFHEIVRNRLRDCGMEQKLTAESFRRGGTRSAAAASADPLRFAIFVGMQQMRSANGYFQGRIVPAQGPRSRKRRRYSGP